MTTYQQQWNAMDTLKIKDLSRCVGYAPSKGRKCMNPIAASNRQEASSLLCQMEWMDVTTADFQNILEMLAPCILCQRNHQNQAPNMVCRWRKEVENLKAQRVQQQRQNATYTQSIPRIASIEPEPAQQDMGIMQSQLGALLQIRSPAPHHFASTSTQQSTIPSSRTLRRQISDEILIWPPHLLPHERVSTSTSTPVPSPSPNLRREIYEPMPTSTSTPVPSPSPISSSPATPPRRRIADLVPTSTSPLAPSPAPTPSSPAAEPATLEPVSPPSTSPPPQQHHHDDNDNHTHLEEEPEQPTPEPLSTEECSICYDPIPPNLGISSHCTHLFHATCINTWHATQDATTSSRAHTCPYCRSEWKRQRVEGNCCICLHSLERRRRRDQDILPSSTIANIATATATASTSASDREHEEASEVAATAEESQEGDEGEELTWCRSRCGQNFHSDCMEQWRAASRNMRGGAGTCPACRIEWGS